MSVQARESINALKDLADGNVIKILGTSVHEFASSRRQYPHQSDPTPFKPGDQVLAKLCKEKGPEGRAQSSVDWPI